MNQNELMGLLGALAGLIGIVCLFIERRRWIGLLFLLTGIFLFVFGAVEEADRRTMESKIGDGTIRYYS